MNIQRVLVIGAGAMGSQIALLCARAGYDTRCHDVAQASLERAGDELRARVERDIEKGRSTRIEADAAWSRLRFGTDLATLAEGVDFVIEAAIEDLALKRKVFAELDHLVPEHAIVATNSSSFVPSKLADASGRPRRFCNVHFFNPALVMKCVEIVAGPATSAATVEAARELVVTLGKTPVVLEKEIPGFVANRILNAARDEAIRLYEGGVASVESIDTACRTALGYPMGPFELMDLTGIDIGYLTKKARFEETNDPEDAPSQSVSDLVARGDLGKKTGRGWYTYTTSKASASARPSVRRPSTLDIAPRQLIMTLYGLYAREEHNWLSVSSVVRLMTDLGEDSAGARSSISRLKRRGVLEARKIDSAAGYSLSSNALEVLREGDLRIFGPKRASESDGLLIVVFSVPESERERRHQLRTLLSSLGFGTIFPGVWVAPNILHDEVAKTLENRGLASYVDVFRATYQDFGTLRDRVSQWWDLQAIQTEYDQFIETFAPVRASWKKSAKRPLTAFTAYIPMLTVWRRLPYLDPGLPLSVLPSDWSGSRATDLFADLDALLRGPAREHALATIHTKKSVAGPNTDKTA